MTHHLRYSPAGLLTLSNEGYILAANETFQEELGYKQTELIGEHLETLCRPGAKMIFHSYFYPNIIMYGVVKELFIKFKHKEGPEIPFILNARQRSVEDTHQIDVVLLTMKRRMEYEQELRQTKLQLEEALRETEAALDQLNNIYQEIQAKQEMLAVLNSELLITANTDNLTGIANRKHLFELLSEYYLLSQSTGDSLSVLLIDIDYFKQVNDVYGHDTGDTVLIRLATLLQQFSRSGQLVGRLGGEEFLMILPNLDKKLSLEVGQRLKELVEQAYWETVGSLTVSIGVATLIAQDSQRDLIKKADVALYYSKENGRNQATHYDDIVTG